MSKFEPIESEKKKPSGYVRSDLNQLIGERGLTYKGPHRFNANVERGEGWT